jgi:hypothetical protein
MRQRSEFRSRGKTGHVIDWMLIVLFCSQLALLLIQIAVHNRIPWVLLFVPLYCLTVPFLITGFGIAVASRSKK